MKRELSDMTLKELWTLFPIFLTEPNPDWESWYEEEERALKAALPDGRIKRISHVGSTAIRGIWAKPIVTFCWRQVRSRTCRYLANCYRNPDTR